MRTTAEVMAGEPHVIDLLESLYRVDRAESEWIEGLRRAFVPSAPGAALVQAFRYDASDFDHFKLWAVHGGDEAQKQWLLGTAGFAPERAALIRDTFSRPAAVMRMSAMHGQKSLRPISEPLFANDLGIVDFWSVGGSDLQRRGVVVGGICSRWVAPMPAGLLTHWQSVAAHMSAAFCLRAAMSAGLAPTESVLAPDGKLLHAEGEARAAEARESLRHAVRAIDRARVRHRQQAGDALNAWQAVVSGRWTLVDQTESDGKRLLLARVNELPVHAEARLSEREAQVMGLAGQGLSNKQISYRLGVGTPAVANYLRRAAQKLGVRNRTELVRPKP